MSTISHPMIAREGWPALALAGLVALGLYFYTGALGSLPGVLAFAVTVYLLRDPDRSVFPDPLALVSPVQGRVADIVSAPDPWLDRQAWRIDVCNSPSDVFSFRSPTEGKVMEQWMRVRDGGYRYAIWVQTDEGDDVVLEIHVPRRSRWRLWHYPRTGERVGHGHRIGFYLFGGGYTVYAPVNSCPRVEIGKRVASGSDVLASLVHKERVTGLRAAS